MSVASSDVASRFPRQFQRVPAESGPGADRIVVDLSGAVGCVVAAVVAVVVSAVVVVVFVVGRSHQASSSIPRSSGQFRARSRWDLYLSGAAGCFVVVGVVVGGGGGAVGGVVGCHSSVSTSIPATSGQFRAQSGQDLVGPVGGSGLFCCCWCCCSWWWWWWRCWWCVRCG